MSFKTSYSKTMADGSTIRKAAVKGNWSTEPMPEQSTTIEINQTYSAEVMKSIEMGLIPEAMEDKWFVYYDQSERKLYFHRSWTGFCIYILQFEEFGDDGQCKATTAEVNRDSAQYTCEDDESDKETLQQLIDWFF